MFRLSVAVALLVGAALVSGANGSETPQIKLGDTLPAFSSLPGVDGKNHSAGEYKQDVLVVCITCNHCPVAVDYEDRIIAFTKKYCSGANAKVGLVAINVNNIEQDKLDKMIIRAKEKGFNFPYLYDASQAIARTLNAKVTPEFYVFDKNRKLVYWGAMDNSQNASKVQTRYLENAVDALLAGKAVPAGQKAFGCSIKYEKQ